MPMLLLLVTFVICVVLFPTCCAQFPAVCVWPGWVMCTIADFLLHIIVLLIQSLMLISALYCHDRLMITFISYLNISCRLYNLNKCSYRIMEDETSRPYWKLWQNDQPTRPTDWPTDRPPPDRPGYREANLPITFWYIFIPKFHR